MRPPEVVCVGLATIDTIVSVPRWPEPDGRVEAEAIVRAAGGPAATAAVALARLGHAVAMVGAVGDDAAGEEARASLVAEGVGVDLLQSRAGPNAESVIVVDRASDSRTILHAPGVTLDGLDEAARSACEAAVWVHADHRGARLIAGVDPARRSIDAGHLGAGPDLDGIGLYAPSLDALLAHTGAAGLHEGLRRALDAGASRVAVTLGADGAVAADSSGAWRARPPRVRVASTVGAGDVFHGALLAQLLEGRALPDALRRATVAATLSCRAPDGRSAIPDGEVLEAAAATAPEVTPLKREGDR